MPAYIQLTHQWNGLLASGSNHTQIKIEQSAHALNISFLAQLTSIFTAPSSPPGFTHGLWEYDVLEVFFMRPDGSYLEIEVGPKVHWLVYEFTSYRKAIEKDLRPLTYTCTTKNLTWHGEFVIPKAWFRIPLLQCRANFYQIRTTKQGREHLAWRSIPQIDPDFHRTECFDFLPA